jgi:hypothetical protein
MTESAAGTGEAPSTEENLAPPWLIELLKKLKGEAARDERPRNKAQGRWLGDFLTNQATQSGLLPAELQLLYACGNGKDCKLPELKELSTLLQIVKELFAQSKILEEETDKDKKEALNKTVLENLLNTYTLKEAVKDQDNLGRNNVVRAEFLRFLALGGDEFAPVHEAGVELHNALVDSKIDLRGAKCAGRLILLKCFVEGALLIEDASLGILPLDGSRVAGITGNRAKISGSVFLQNGFVSEGEVSFHSAEIGGNLQCTGAKIGGNLDCVGAKIGGNVLLNAGFECKGLAFFNLARIGGDLDCCGGTFVGVDGWAIVATGAIVSGDVKLSSFRDEKKNLDPCFKAEGSVSLVNADIGESLDCSAASFKRKPAGVVLDFSRAKIKGDVSLNCPAKDKRFEAEGEVRFVSARIGGDVNFGGASIRNENGQAITADNAKTGGLFAAVGFVVRGLVSLSGAEISKDLDFRSSAIENPDNVALNCSLIRVKGLVMLGHWDRCRFEAFGMVNFYGAEIGVNFECFGGRFVNPKGVALDCQVAKIACCVFLGTNYDDKVKYKLAFEADGEVKFIGASVGLQFNCLGGHFRNANPDPLNRNYAGTALNLAVATIKDTLFLGVGEQKKRENNAREPATVEGSINLSAASVRVLVDDKLVGGGERGLRPAVNGEDAKERSCHLLLDNFTYDRLVGDDACNAKLRKAWLERQPPEHLKAEFRPQPFEQLVKVLRAMGQNKAADEIALLKRLKVWEAAPWKEKPWPAWAIPLVYLLVLPLLVNPWWSWLFFSIILVVLAHQVTVLARPVILVLTHLVTDLVRPVTKLAELVLLQKFLGYGYRIGQALVILVILGIGYAWFYQQAFEQCAIVPSGTDIRALDCKHWSASASYKQVVLVPFNAWLYSADVIIPVVELGQKKAWQPANNVSIELRTLGRLETPNLVYYVQLTETVLGWMGALLLVSFVGGLIKKE